MANPNVVAVSSIQAKTAVDADGDVELIPIAEIIRDDRIENSK